MNFSDLMENDDNPSLAKDIIKNSPEFIKYLQNDGNVLYRGMSGDKFLNHTEHHLKTRKNRNPLHTPDNIHYMLDYYFFKNFGVKARSSSVFVTTSKANSIIYGNTMVCIPDERTNVSYIYSEKVRDLFSLMNKITYGNVDVNTLAEQDKEFFEKNYHDIQRKIFDELDKSNYRKDNTPQNIPLSHEIMMDCDNYYLFGINSYTAYELETRLNIKF